MSTTTELKKPPTAPPAPTASSVRSYRKLLEIERDALKAGAPALAAASALGDLGAKADLAALHAKLAALQFEIDCNDLAVELARAEDSARETVWRASIQELPADEIIAGIGKEKCCDRCTPGVNGGCVITASARHAGPTCGHPLLTRHLQHLTEDGRRIFRYADTPRSAEIYSAACRKLKVSS
jgi:hypothetical protein